MTTNSKRLNTTLIDLKSLIGRQKGVYVVKDVRYRLNGYPELVFECTSCGHQKVIGIKNAKAFTGKYCRLYHCKYVKPSRHTNQGRGLNTHPKQTDSNIEFDFGHAMESISDVGFF